MPNITPSESKATRSILYSGHMIDAPDRAVPRFPATLEDAVTSSIAREVEALHPCSKDVAFGSGACGSDLIFAQELLARGVPLRLYLPFPAEEFLMRSVAFAGNDWVTRFRSVAQRADVYIATEHLGLLSEGEDPYERNNSWMLEQARRFAANEVVFLCVWNGQGGDGPGGTQHMIEVVRRSGGEVQWIDTREL